MVLTDCESIIAALACSFFFDLLEPFWFYADELLQFSHQALGLSEGKLKKASLSAMSEFKLDVMAKDQTGHFIIRFELDNLTLQNMAVLNIELETQELLDLGKFLASLA